MMQFERQAAAAMNDIPTIDELCGGEVAVKDVNHPHGADWWPHMPKGIQVLWDRLGTEGKIIAARFAAHVQRDYELTKERMSME